MVVGVFVGVLVGVLVGVFVGVLVGVLPILVAVAVAVGVGGAVAVSVAVAVDRLGLPPTAGDAAPGRQMVRPDATTTGILPGAHCACAGVLQRCRATARNAPAPIR